MSANNYKQQPYGAKIIYTMQVATTLYDLFCLISNMAFKHQFYDTQVKLYFFAPKARKWLHNQTFEEQTSTFIFI